MAIEYRLPEDIQETHWIVSEVNLTAPPQTTAAWLKAMAKQPGMEIMLDTYKTAFVAARRLEEEPAGDEVEP